MRRYAYIKREKGEPNVVSGLALTPADMLDRAREGKTIQSLMVSEELFEVGTSYKDFDVPIERQRGIDINVVWNKEEDLKKKVYAKERELRKQQQKGGE